MKTGISTALRNHYAAGSTTLATCWKATLKDGTVVAATSHQRDIVFGGVTYLSAAAYTPTDIESSADLSPDNLELEGFLASPAIRTVDLHTGLWDYAAIEIFEVNYKDLTMGRNRVRDGTLGEVKGSFAKFRAELRGLTQAYSRKIVSLILQDCSARLGDARCKINIALHTHNGTVQGITDNRVIQDAARTEPYNYLTRGLLTFTSGLNAGLSMEVKINDGLGYVTLQQGMPFAIAIGDTYTVTEGCPGRFDEDCKTRFNNVLNYRGHPAHIFPGSDAYAGASRA